jgi:hypothetical protein
MFRVGSADRSSRRPFRITSSTDNRLRWYVHTFLVGMFIAASLFIDGIYVGHFVQNPHLLFSDASLYWDATGAWLSGADPWAVVVGGVRFAGIPPTLLLNLPLQPLGPEIARPFWAVAGICGWLFALRRMRMPPWWLLFPPMWEAWLAGGPDPALLGLAVAGGGAAVAAFTKPYSVPGLLAIGRWRAAALGCALIVVSIPFLPWALFLADLDIVRSAFAEQTRPITAWGIWPLFVAAAASLLTIQRPVALAMLVPVLSPAAQPHYALFGIGAIRASPWLAICLALPYAAAPGVVVYAIARAVWRRFIAPGPS